MKRIVFVITVLLVCKTAIAETERGLLVKWKEGPTSLDASDGNARLGSSVQRNFNAIGWQHVELPPGMSVRDGMEAYRNLSAVLAVEPDGIIAPILPPVGRAVPSAPIDEDDAPANDGAVGTPRPTIGLHAPPPPPPQPPPVIPNDPMFSQQWYLPKIGATNAWNVTTGSSNVVVAIFDSGVDYTHPDLAPNMWRNPGETGLDDQGRDKATNGIDDDSNGYVDDVHGINPQDDNGDPMDIGPFFHGTSIAGFIGAAGNNGLGITGLNWSVRLMAIRVIGGNLADPSFIAGFFSDNLAALDYVLMMKRRGVNIRVTNHSYGANVESAAISDALAALGSEGVLHVCAAMNFTLNQDVFAILPAGHNQASVISVAASTETDALADFSDYGQSTVDLAAPGVNLLSTWKGATNYLGGFDGTSGSCPIVAGAAALLLAVNPNLTVDELKSALFGSVDQPVALRGKVITNGRLNVARAIEYLTNANPPAIVITALPAGNRSVTNAPIQVTFNRPMNRASVEGAFVITPPMSGMFIWTNDDRSFSFHHDLPFNAATNYSVRILGTAQDQTGATLDGDFDRTREGSPADDVVWTFRFPISNDDFVNARMLTGTSGSVTANNRNAYLEVNEPRTFTGNWRLYGYSVWYRWTPPEPGGWFTFDLTSGTVFDSLLIAYTGDQLDHLVAVAGNDNSGSRIQSRVSFAATPGTNYSIVVAGKSEFDPTLAGAFQLRWYPTPPPGFTGAQISPSSGVPGSTLTLFGTNFTGATSVLFNGASSSFSNALTNNLDLRITAVVPPDAISGPITIVTPHGNVTSTAVFEVLRPTLALTRTAPAELTLSWTGTSFGLESSSDLRTWTQIMAPGSNSASVGLTEERRFFRLRSQ